MATIHDFHEVTPYIWEIPRSFREDMLVPARIYASRRMLEQVLDERAAEQLVNVATLPGIKRYALAMPDIHQGYGFPIGGVAALRAQDGVISPGGVGYDINCGVRLLASRFQFDDIAGQLVALANQMQRDVPSGVGRGGPIVLQGKEIDAVLRSGARWAIDHGYGTWADAEVIEENGCLAAADPSLVSDNAKRRGADQLGTLGAGNHFLEIQKVVDVFDEQTAGRFGIFRGQVTVMIHTGSRGLGHQTCTDYVQLMNRVMAKYGIVLPDRELACVPFATTEGQQYFHAMSAAANFALANRQLITHHVREAWKRVLHDPSCTLEIVYDVAHNMAKLEWHDSVQCVVHRKGATRAFGPGRPEIPEKYRETGQPVLIPGSMGTHSYVLAGTEIAMKDTFGSTCHGAGRRMSRSEAKRTINYEQMRRALEAYGVVVRGGSAKGLLEEAAEAYKDIDEVVDVVHQAGIARKVAKMKPVAIIKG
jgi:tRNA-splicing ligase RtcB